MTPLERLYARGQFAMKLGLDNTRALLEALDDPHRPYKVVHVAGTNGKGSVAAMVASALSSAGLITGLYTSPHLTHIEERIAIDGEPITPHALRMILEYVFLEEEKAVAAGRMAGPATFFELVTASAFVAFATAKLDVAVVEVGMGGRFDATNLVEPAVTAITSIALDHTAYLGDTIEAIAGEKAGIMKAGVPCVVGETAAEAVRVFERQAADTGARLHLALEECRWEAAIVDGATMLTLATPSHDYGTLRLGLNGRHQARNAVVAVRVLEEATAAGLEVPAPAIVAGLADASWPARLEVLPLADGREVVLDAAHNPAGAVTLAEWLAETGRREVTFVLGLMRDKDAAAVVDALAGLARRIVCTTADPARGLDASALAAIVRERAPQVGTAAIAAPQAALAEALEGHGAVCVAGSIYLAGALRPALLALAGAEPEAPTLH